MRARLLPVIALAVAAGCGDDPVEPLEFDVTLTTSVSTAIMIAVMPEPVTVKRSSGSPTPHWASV